MNTYPVQLTCNQESTIYHNAMCSRVNIARKAWGHRKDKDMQAIRPQASQIPPTRLGDTP
jgi:hypothetical protein